MHVVVILTIHGNSTPFEVLFDSPEESFYLFHNCYLKIKNDYLK